MSYPKIFATLDFIWSLVGKIRSLNWTRSKFFDVYLGGYFAAESFKLSFVPVFSSILYHAPSIDIDVIVENSMYNLTSGY